MCDSGNLGILLGNSLSRIDHDHDNMCTFYSRNCTNYAVALNLFLDLALTAKTCSINENIFLALPFYLRIDSIASGSGNIGHDHTILSEKAVDKGRFTYVWLTYNSNLRNIVVFFCIKSFRKFLDNFIQHITKSGAVCC